MNRNQLAILITSILVITGVSILIWSFRFNHIQPPQSNMIMVTTPLIGRILRDLAPDKIDIFLSPEDNPHYVQITPKTLERLEQASKIIAVNPYYETWIPKSLSDKVIYLTNSTDMVHFWVSPHQTKAVFLLLLERLENEKIFSIQETDEMRKKIEPFLKEVVRFIADYQDLNSLPFKVATTHFSLSSLQAGEIPELIEWSLDKFHEGDEDHHGHDHHGHDHHGHHHHDENSPQNIVKFFENLKTLGVKCLLGVGATSSAILEVAAKHGLSFVGELEIDETDDLFHLWRHNLKLLQTCQKLQ